MRIFRFVQENFLILVLLVIEIALFFANYKGGTYLVGWDNLYPELNFPANFERGLFAVWQEYRGLGLLDGMTHAANLPHTLFLWLLHFVLSENLLRYFFIFLMHFIGGVGFFIIAKKLFKNNSIAAFLGAVFYLVNLGTIQMFYAPLEVFAVHFGFMPWLIMALINLLDNPNKKNALTFVLLLLFAIPQGFIPTIFAAFLIPVFFTLFFRYRDLGRKALFGIATSVIFIFSINAFWLLPYTYSVFKNAPVITAAKINQMSSEDIYLKNKAKGGVLDVISFKGFMLDTIEYRKDIGFSFIMTEWKKHTENILFFLISLMFSLITIIGVVSALIKREKNFYPFAASLGVAFMFLASNTFPFSLLNNLIRAILPFFAEAFRFPFTKFEIIFVFCASVFFGYGLIVLFQFIKGVLSPPKIQAVIAIFALSLFFYCLPAFQGYFFLDDLRLPIPGEYQQAIKFFDDKQGRITTLPQPSFWSWRFYSWGEKGSGFLWYGIKLPTLERAFDPWSRESENYYWELSYAIYSKNTELFEKVLEKYNVNWIILDRNIVNPTSPRALYLNELEEMLAKSSKFSSTAQFGNIKIYKVNLLNQPNNFVLLYNSLPSVLPTYKWNNFDAAYSQLGNYISTVTNSYYPFRSLFTGKAQNQLEFKIEEGEDTFLLREKIPAELKSAKLSIPQEGKELVWVDPKNSGNMRYLKSAVNRQNDIIEAIVPKVGGYLSANLEADDTRIVKNGCDSKDSKICSASFWLPNLPHNLSYLITVESRNVKGKSINFWLENPTSKKPDIETYLPKKSKLTTSYFIQPPMEADGVGYALHFDNISIGNTKSVNELGEITVNVFPYRFLTNLNIVSDNVASSSSQVGDLKEVFHPNPAIYKVTGKIDKDSFLVLSQAFDSGWQAYYVNGNTPIWLSPFLGKKVQEHVLINNWANGWQLNDSTKHIVMVYLPQYLEFFGFTLIIPTLVFIFWPQIVRFPKFRYN